LLRIARRAGVPEQPLSERELAEGRWQIVRTPETATASERGWIDRRLTPESPYLPTAWLSRWLVRRFGGQWAGRRGAAIAIAGGAVLGMIAAAAAAWFGFAALSFALLVPSAMVIESESALRLLDRPIFIPKPGSPRVYAILYGVWDLVVLALGVLAIDGSRVHRLFPPLVLLGLLRSSPSEPRGWRTLPADRGLLAAVLAVAAHWGLSEGAFMAIALVLLAVRLAQFPARTRLTQV